jgi:hypothetical protein
MASAIFLLMSATRHGGFEGYLARLSPGALHRRKAWLKALGYPLADTKPHRWLALTENWLTISTTILPKTVMWRRTYQRLQRQAIEAEARWPTCAIWNSLR